MSTFLRISLLVLLLSITPLCQSEDMEIPLIWKGAGQGWIMTFNGVEELAFDLQIAIDEIGSITGHTSTPEGSIPVEKLYINTDIPGNTRVVLITVLYDQDNPTLFIMNGRLLQNQLFYGEVTTKKFDMEGEVEKSLNIGKRVLEKIPLVGYPEPLDQALKITLPIGVVKIVGTYTPQKKEPPSVQIAEVSKPATAVVQPATPELPQIDNATESISAEPSLESKQVPDVKSASPEIDNATPEN